MSRRTITQVELDRRCKISTARSKLLTVMEQTPEMDTVEWMQVFTDLMQFVLKIELTDDDQEKHDGKPEGMSHDECEPLCTFSGEDAGGSPIVISCWKLTADELAEINRTGRVWLGIMGHTMPPAWVAGCKPFADQEPR